MTRFIVSRPVLDHLRRINQMGPRALNDILATLPKDLGNSAADQHPAPRLGPPLPVAGKAEAPHAGSRIRFEVPGYSGSADSQIVALAEILRRLSKARDDFLTVLARRVQGRTRNHIARRPADVYPLRPDLGEDAIEFVPGWFIGRNIANREKVRILEEACRIAGLRLGIDVKFGNG